MCSFTQHNYLSKKFLSRLTKLFLFQISFHLEQNVKNRENLIGSKGKIQGNGDRLSSHDFFRRIKVELEVVLTLCHALIHLFSWFPPPSIKRLQSASKPITLQFIFLFSPIAFSTRWRNVDTTPSLYMRDLDWLFYVDSLQRLMCNFLKVRVIRDGPGGLSTSSDQHRLAYEVHKHYANNFLDAIVLSRWMPSHNHGSQLLQNLYFCLSLNIVIKWKIYGWKIRNKENSSRLMLLAIGDCTLFTLLEIFK